MLSLHDFNSRKLSVLIMPLGLNMVIWTVSRGWWCHNVTILMSLSIRSRCQTVSMARACLVSALLPLALAASSPELYRSLVEDRFLTERRDTFDPIFTDLDLGYRDSFKRELFSDNDLPNDLSQAQDGVSLFLFNEKTDDASSPFPAPRISRFVNLGGFQSQSNPIHFFESPRNLESGEENISWS